MQDVASYGGMLGLGAKQPVRWLMPGDPANRPEVGSCAIIPRCNLQQVWSAGWGECERWCAQPLGCTRHATRGSLEVTMLGGLGGQSLGLHNSYWLGISIVICHPFVLGISFDWAFRFKSFVIFPLVRWLNQPIWNICASQIGSFPRKSVWQLVHSAPNDLSF